MVVTCSDFAECLGHHSQSPEPGNEASRGLGMRLVGDWE